MGGVLKGLLRGAWHNKGKLALLGGAAAVDQYAFDGAGRHAVVDKAKQYSQDPSQIKRDFSGVVDAGHDVAQTGKTIWNAAQGKASWSDFLKPDANGESLLGKLANLILPMVVGAFAGSSMGLGWGGALVMAGAATFIWKTFLEDKVTGMLGNVFKGHAQHDPSAPSSAIRLDGPGPVGAMEDYAPGY